MPMIHILEYQIGLMLQNELRLEWGLKVELNYFHQKEHF